MRIAAIVWCSSVPGLQVYLFRRIREDLIKNHMEGPKGFRSMLAAWSVAGWCHIVEDEIRFWNGSKIYLCHCKDEKDIYKYQGAEIHVLLLDELTHFTETMYRFLRNRVRMVGLHVPPEYAGRFPRILCGANPGNIGHLWVKTTFVTARDPMTVALMQPSEGGMQRQYIPARLEDNPSMAEDDPGYENRLEGLGSKTLVMAMRWGDWNVIEGAFFDCWDERRHVVTPFAVPDDWPRFRSGDWGSASPFSIGWWAIAGDEYTLPERTGAGASTVQRLPNGNGEHGRNAVANGNGANGARRVDKSGAQIRHGAANNPASVGDGRHREPAASEGLRPANLAIRPNTIPRGALVRYREWYGASSPNVGLKLTAEQVADGIVSREKSDPKLTYGVLDPSAFKEDGGPSIGERINGRLIAAKMAPFRGADNTRVPQRGAMGGWDLVRARMVGDGERPMIYIFSTCRDFIRTVAVMQHDTARPEDIDTDSEDHAIDESRYACASRPWLKPVKKPDPDKLDAYRGVQTRSDSFMTM